MLTLGFQFNTQRGKQGMWCWHHQGGVCVTVLSTSVHGSKLLLCNLEINEALNKPEHLTSLCMTLLGLQALRIKASSSGQASTSPVPVLDTPWGHLRALPLADATFSPSLGLRGSCWLTHQPFAIGNSAGIICTAKNPVTSPVMLSTLLEDVVPCHHYCPFPRCRLRPIFPNP